MRRMSRIVGCGVVFSVVMPGLADIPAALDRVPANAGMVAAIPNLAEFHKQVSGLVTMLGLQEREFGQGVAMAGMLLQSPGLNAAGSVAVAIMPGPDGTLDFDGEQPPMAFIVPVTNFGEFVGAFDGQVEQTIATLDMWGETMFLKDAGGGYAVLGADRDIVQAFNAAPGQRAAHEARLGTTGRRVADTSDFFIAVDVQTIAPMLREAAEGIRENFEMASMMMGEQAAGMEAMGEMMSQSVDTFIRDAQVGLFGLDLSDAGVSFDLAAQFKEGSETGRIMQSGGNAGSLLSRVPNMPFLFAMSMDMSSPQIKDIFKQMAHMSAQMNPAQANMLGMMNIGEMLDNQDGMAMVMGNPPSLLMGGMFSQTVQYTKCRNPAQALDSIRQAMVKMDGQASGPISFKTTYKKGAATVDGVSVDSWGMQMKADPADPTAGQFGVGMAMIFGPSNGPSGYYATTTEGIVTTFVQSTPLMSQALKASKGENDLSENDAIQTASAQLPRGTVFEFYLGLDAVIQQMSMFMAMAGQSLDVEAPENLGALAFGVAVGDGGAQGRVFVPGALVKFISQVVEAQQGQFDDGDAPPAPDRGNRPRF